MVLLHPGQGGIVLWEPQFEEFARSHRVVCYDARGFGRSERPPQPYTFYADLLAVLDALRIERAGLVGLSLGGRTMLDFALMYPDRVACLVLVNPGMSGYAFTGLDRYAAGIKDANERADLDAFVEVQLRMWFDGPTRDPAQVDRAQREEVRRATTEQMRRGFSGPLAPFTELNAAERLAEIAAPTLVVEAALDQLDIHAICDLIVARVPGASRVRIDGAAHLVNLEKPKEFAAAVLPFLAAHPGA